jgi:hypothetical protein
MDDMDRGARRTGLGTPCSSAWDDAHIARVEAAELQLNRPICGARTLTGNLCTLEPNHDNGRCRFHGGFNLTGAQPGNRNAVIHGLYSRAIQTCGEQCPMWKTCPCAGPDIAKLDARDRPRCPYEVAAFNAAVTDARAHLAAAAPNAQHVACELAMVRVLLLRTASALATQSPVDTTIITGEKYGMTSKKPGAYLQAFMRVSSEHRRYVQLYGMTGPRLPSDGVVREKDRRTRFDTSLLPEDLAKIERTDWPLETHASLLLNQAAEEALAGFKSHALTTYRRAHYLAPHIADAARDKESPSFLDALDLIVPQKTASNGKRVDDS